MKHIFSKGFYHHILYFGEVAVSNSLLYTFSDLSMVGIAVPRLSIRSPSRKRSLQTTTNTHDRCK